MPRTCHAHATCTHACYIHAQEQREWQHARQSAALLQQGAATTSKSSKLLGVGVGATAGEAGALRLEVRTSKLAVVEQTLTPTLALTPTPTPTPALVTLALLPLNSPSATAP